MCEQCVESMRQIIGGNAGDGKMRAQRMTEQAAKQIEDTFAWIELVKIEMDGLDVKVQLEHSYPAGINIQTAVKAWVTAELTKAANGAPPLRVRVWAKPCDAGAHRRGEP